MSALQSVEKHTRDLHDTISLTCSIKEGMVVRYDGVRFWDRFGALGHSSTDPRKCRCGSAPHFEK